MLGLRETIVNPGRSENGTGSERSAGPVPFFAKLCRLESRSGNGDWLAGIPRVPVPISTGLCDREVLET